MDILLRYPYNTMTHKIVLKKLNTCVLVFT